MSARSSSRAASRAVLAVAPALAPGCVIDMRRTSPGSGGVITGMATTAIIVGIPVRLQLEGEADADRRDDRRTVRIEVIVTEAVVRLDVVPERLELHAAVNVGVGAHGNGDDAGDAEVTEL